MKLKYQYIELVEQIIPKKKTRTFVVGNHITNTCLGEIKFALIDPFFGSIHLCGKEKEKEK